MARVNLTDALRVEYQRLFDSCIAMPARAGVIETIVNRILTNRPRYAAVGAPLGIPWHVVGVVHAMESSLNFKAHLHNGDPLTARTRQVPSGRPIDGTPPFTWEVSASDALRLQRLDRWTEWSVPGTLYQLEAYNGFGYRMRYPHVLSPYLWSFSNHYTRGKFVADGRFSDAAISQQCGGAVILRRISERQLIDVTAELPPSRTVTIRHVEPLLHFTPGKVSPYGKQLQAFLNTLPNIYLKEDGRLGERTSDALQAVSGHRLHGDPRA